MLRDRLRTPESNLLKYTDNVCTIQDEEEVSERMRSYLQKLKPIKAPDPTMAEKAATASSVGGSSVDGADSAQFVTPLSSPSQITIKPAEIADGSPEGLHVASAPTAGPELATGVPVSVLVDGLTVSKSEDSSGLNSHATEKDEQRHVEEPVAVDPAYALNADSIDRPTSAEETNNDTDNEKDEPKEAEDETKYPGGFALGILTFGLCMATFVVALDNTIIGE